MAGQAAQADPLPAPGGTLAPLVHTSVKNENSAQSCDAEHMLPIANISRIMKRVLPENAKIAKEAKECVQECVTEFIQFITSEASDKCLQEKRKTINGDDLICALYSLGFEKYVEPLNAYLRKWRESLATLNPALRDKIVQEQKAAVNASSVTYTNSSYMLNPYASFGSSHYFQGSSAATNSNNQYLAAYHGNTPIHTNTSIYPFVSMNDLHTYAPISAHMHTQESNPPMHTTPLSDQSLSSRPRDSSSAS